MSRPVFPFAPRALLAASFLALAACAQSNLAAPPADPQPAPVVQAAPTPDPAPVESQAVASDIVRVGIMVPLSGSAAGVGRDLLDAAQLALFDFTPPLFELRVYDSGSSPVIAASAAARARADGVRILLGPLFSEAVTAAADVLRPHGIPVYAFSSDRLVSGNLVSGNVSMSPGFFQRRKLRGRLSSPSSAACSVLLLSCRMIPMAGV